MTHRTVQDAGPTATATPTRPLLDRLHSGTPLLGDGATGTMLHLRADLPSDACFEALVLTAPDVVLGLHRDYVAAGVDVLSTNTFAANAVQLRRHGHADRVEASNRAAVDLARTAIGDADVLLAGTVGPLGVPMAPYGRLSAEEAKGFFVQQMRALEGVDVIALETFGDHGELLTALAAAREVHPDVPVIAHATFARDDRTVLGVLPGRVAAELHAAGADVIGVNCSGGPAQIQRLIEAMRRSVPDARLSAYPNAGFAEQVGGRVLYPATPQYFAQATERLRAVGVQLVGGCCGTTPEHIAAMRTVLDDPTPPAPIAIAAPTVAPTSDAPTLEPTELGYRLAKRQFTVTVELSPPRGHDTARLLRAAELLRDAGAHLIDVADSPAARMRMSPWAAAQVLQSQVGLETILHFPTRGRNLLRVQGDLLAAHALGLRNLFVTMGDPTRIGDFPEAMDAFDIAPSALIGTIAGRMNVGEDLGGNDIGRPTGFTVGCALNMFADDLDHELDVLERKMEAGAHFALGQAVFEPSRISRFLEAYEARHGRPFDLPVLMGIMPLFGTRQARFLHEEVPGIVIPKAIFERLDAAGDRAPDEGVAIAEELVEAVRPLVAGAYVIPALGKYELAARVVASATR